MTGRSLIRRQAAEVAPAENAGGALMVPPAVQEAMTDLLVACPPHPGEDGTDRMRLLRIWTRETSGFEPEIVAEALHSLLRKNPRNPFRPSVEDMIERCRQVRREWRDRVMRYYEGRSDEPPPTWCETIATEGLRKYLDDFCASSFGPPDGCSPYAGVSNADYSGAYFALVIGPSLVCRWPESLLAERRLLIGARATVDLLRRLRAEQPLFAGWWAGTCEEQERARKIFYAALAEELGPLRIEAKRKEGRR